MLSLGSGLFFNGIKIIWSKFIIVTSSISNIINLLWSFCVVKTFYEKQLVT